VSEQDKTTGLAGAREAALRTERASAHAAEPGPEFYTINGAPACGAPVDGGRCGRHPGHGPEHPHIMEPGTDEPERHPITSYQDWAARNGLPTTIAAAKAVAIAAGHGEPVEPGAGPCPCVSCDGQCGGGCGGPVKLTVRGPVCPRCAELADTFDDDFTGAKATIAQDRVRLAVDSFSGSPASIYLDIPDLDALVIALIVKRHELAARRAAEQA
jgi:hypothetical protein